MGKYAHGDQYRDRTTKSTFRKSGAKTLFFLYFAPLFLRSCKKWKKWSKNTTLFLFSNFSLPFIVLRYKTNGFDYVYNFRTIWVLHWL